MVREYILYNGESIKIIQTFFSVLEYTPFYVHSSCTQKEPVFSIYCVLISIVRYY